MQKMYGIIIELEENPILIERETSELGIVAAARLSDVWGEGDNGTNFLKLVDKVSPRALSEPCLDKGAYLLGFTIK
jgi:hypothetical protein